MIPECPSPSASPALSSEVRAVAALGVVAIGLCLRVVMAGAAGASSVAAAAAFSAVLLLGAIGATGAAAVPMGPIRRGAVVERGAGAPGRATAGPLGVAKLGFLGSAGLVLGPLLTHGARFGGRPHTGSALLWAATVVLVAVAEEVMLRGVLWDAVADIAGIEVTLGLTTVVFALIHVPLYGWHALPLDLAVGLWLGGLRLWSGHLAAPAIAHALADLCAWWL